jgi:hypothetical protein
MVISTGWRPKWWHEDTHGSAWSRVKEALRRDWDQTKKDLHIGGHELNQSVTDTVKQAAGKQPLPLSDKPNPPKVIGDWDEAELPLGYGYSARREYGQKHADWSDELEGKLKSEWEDPQNTGRRDWDDVKPIVRHGWDKGTE